MKADVKNLTTYENLGTKRDRIQAGFYRECAIINPENGRSVVIIRLYSTGQTFHCLAWFFGRDANGSGYGSAGGGNYCKASAAAEHAIECAGIELSERIHGMGLRYIEKAALAIGQKLTGKRKLICHLSHA